LSNLLVCNNIGAGLRHSLILIGSSYLGHSRHLELATWYKVGSF
jgi:hypothetical protein